MMSNSLLDFPHPKLSPKILPQSSHSRPFHFSKKSNSVVPFAQAKNFKNGFILVSILYSTPFISKSCPFYFILYHAGTHSTTSSKYMGANPQHLLLELCSSLLSGSPFWKPTLTLV